MKIKILRETNITIVGQYIGFCRVFNEQRKKYDNSIDTAKETYRICIEKGYLTEFLKKHEQEVVDMLTELFDEEYQRAQYDRAAQKAEYEAGVVEGEARGRAEGRLEGLKQALQVLIKRGLTEEEAKRELGLA